MLIDTSFFQFPCVVPNIDKPTVMAQLNLFINTYEPKFLEKVLGPRLYAAYKSDNTTPRFVDLINGKNYTPKGETFPINWQGLVVNTNGQKSSVVALYVYYNYQVFTVSNTTGNGEQITVEEASVSVPATSKFVEVWNSLVVWLNDMYKFLKENEDVYPELQDYKWEEAIFKNSLDL